MIDSIVQFGRAFASSISTETKAILAQVSGIAGLDPDDELDDNEGEVGQNSEVFGALGVVSRPKAPETSGNKEFAAEVVCLRTSDGLVPVAWRDLRLDAAFPNGQKEGSTALVGYGKGFITLDLNADGENILVAYCPYNFVNGVAQKALAIMLDSTDESISIVHGEGQLFTMTNDGAISMQSKSITGAPKAVFRLEDAKITMQSDQIVLNGTVIIGNPTGAILPLAAGAASPPCPRLFLNPAA